MCCAPEEIAFGDLFRVLLPKAFIPLRVMGHFSLSAYESSAFTATKLKCPPDFVRKAFVRGKRFELSHPFGRYHLKVVRLPISPPTHRLWCQNFEVAAKIVFSDWIFGHLPLFFQYDPESGSLSQL